MQEQIKELVKQAGLNIDGYGYPIWGCLHGEDEKKEFLEKFAELIVKECISQIENLSPGYEDYRYQIEDAFRRDCVDQLKQHFGVE